MKLLKLAINGTLGLFDHELRRRRFEKLEDRSPLPLILSRLTGPVVRFVQIGANDGVHLDPIRGFITNNLITNNRRWTGHLVEPNPVAFERLKKNCEDFSSRLILHNFALVDNAHQRKLRLYIPDGQDFRANSSKGKLYQSKTVEEIEVRAVFIDWFFDRVGIPDVLIVDTEGYDYRIMKRFLAICTSRGWPKVIQFEHGFMTKDEYREMTDLLQFYHVIQTNCGDSPDTIASLK